MGKFYLNKKVLIIFLLLILVNISVISAQDVDNSTMSLDNGNMELNQVVNSSYTEDSNILSDSQELKPDVPDLVDNDNGQVYPSNIKNYFPNGILSSKYAGKSLIFSGDFEDIGNLVIDVDDVYITGVNANLKNTFFELEGYNITLKNLNMDLNVADSKNNGAAIFITGDEINLINMDINYIVPRDVEAYAILANDGPTSFIRIINSSIYFEGHNDNLDKYNCAVKLIGSYNSLMENNTIATSLPLKKVKYGLNGAVLDSDFVFTVGIEDCDNFIFNNNTLISDVNKRPAVEYPTLNCLMISKSDNVLVSNNDIYMTDFVTYMDIDNYLYGIDASKSNYLKIVNNSVSIVTTGGKLAAGSAYPIQVSGPAEYVNITENDLYSFSNGPNIGIYSQNFYGETALSITNNKINVTGLAGTHEWALVTGIESQDSRSVIVNNQIEVHSIADVGLNDNLYAISYRQNIPGTHEFYIKDNFAITDGYYSVYLLNSQHSTIINNTLVSLNKNADESASSYAQGPKTHYSDNYYNNRVIKAVNYFSSINNNIDGGNEFYLGDSSNLNNINTNSISPKNQGQSYNTNPLIPSFSNTVKNSASSSENSIGDSSYQGTLGNDNGQGYSNGQGSTESNNQNGNGNSNVGTINLYGEGSSNSTNVQGSGNAISNSSSSSPSADLSTSPLTGGQSSASSESSSVSKKAYEIDELTEKENFIPSVIYVIITMFLILCGYRRKSKIMND